MHRNPYKSGSAAKTSTNLHYRICRNNAEPISDKFSNLRTLADYSSACSQLNEIIKEGDDVVLTAIGVIHNTGVRVEFHSLKSYQDFLSVHHLFKYNEECESRPSRAFSRNG